MAPFDFSQLLWIEGVLFTLWSTRFFLIGLQVLGRRRGLLRTSLIARDDTPPELAPVFDAAHETLSALGFIFAHAQRIDNPATQRPDVCHIYWHAEAHAYAEVTANPTLQTGQPFAVEFITHFADGTAVATIDGFLHLVEPFPPSYALHDHYCGNLEQQWAAHVRELRQRATVSEPVWRNAAEYVAAANQFNEATLRFHIDTGWWVPTADPDLWRLSCTSAIKMVRQIVRGQKKSRGLAKSRRGPAGEMLAAEVASDINAFERVHDARRGSAGWLGKTLLFVGSGLACALVFGLAFSWRTVPVLLGTLLFHEAGHLLGMRWFGYRDTQILFLPFLGAAALGDKQDATPRQELIVLLLGPVPGLIVGVLCFLASLPYGMGLWTEIGAMAVLLNGLNLLPVLPFDGGRIVEVLFARYLPRAQLVFWLTSIGLLLAFGWWSGDSVLVVLGAVLVFGFPQQWRWAVAVTRVTQMVPPIAERSARVGAIFRVLAESPFRTQSTSARFDLARRLLNHLSVAPATWSTMIMGGLVYVGCLAAVTGLPLYFVVFDRPDVQARFLRTTLWQVEELTAPDESDTDTAPALVYMCPPATTEAEGHDGNSGPEASSTVIGTFDTATAAPEIAAQMRARSRAVRATTFGQTVFLASLDENAVPETTLVETIQGQHGTVFIEKQSRRGAALASVRCTAGSDAIADELREEIELYFQMPSRARVQAPWAFEDTRNADEKATSARTRSTYYRLCLHIAQTLAAASFNDIAERYLRAREAHDDADEEAARVQLEGERHALIESVIDAFARTKDPRTDPEVVAEYLRYVEEQAQGSRVYDLFGFSSPELLAAMSTTPGSSRSPASAFGGHVHRNGRNLDVNSVHFLRTAIGLPAFARYLCAHGCSEIHYDLRPVTE